MSALTALARVEAVAIGRARPIATVRHVHLADRPLVVVPLALAGEANAPLAALVGTAEDSPTLLVVPQPRNRDQRFAFATLFAAHVLPHVTGYRGATEIVPGGRGKPDRQRALDAPQLLVPNSGGVAFLKLFGRSTRFRRIDGPYPVDPSVPLLGRWLTFFAERAEHPGSCLLLAMTEALALHWATGQSALEDANLAALLGWIDPPPGMTGAQAAAAAEDPSTSPPAGPTTDPTFDNEILAPAIEAYQRSAGDAAATRRALAHLESVLYSQLEPTWRLMWRGVDMLRGLPPGASVAARWTEDRDAYTFFAAHLDEGGPPQPRRDGAVAAAARLHRLEQAAMTYQAQRAFDDPLVMAEYRLTGEAFAGEVVSVDAARVVGEGRSRKLRPLVTVRSVDPVRPVPGTKLRCPEFPRQTGVVVDVDGADVVLELSGGMGNVRVAPAGTIPEVGQRVVYSSAFDDYQAVATWPASEETPWTHGGPPPDYQPTDEDATEEWS
ncbi:MAG TPA: hypothetical protein VF054_06830 [Micromonosporaceae bacterium]